MSRAEIHRLSAAEFFDWQDEQDELYELIDGVPVGMVGTRRQHDRIVVNAFREITAQLRGKPCQPFTESIGVRIPAGNIRRPDLGVDCSPLDGQAMTAGDVRLVIEVLSRSTRSLDQVGKLEEYKTIDGLDYILLADPERPHVILWFRDAARTWRHRGIEGLDASIELPELELTLRMADLYDGLSFRPSPKLVRG
jgi:Uma2 family endonuclease